MDDEYIEELHAAADAGDAEALFTLRFLSQPFFVAEIYTNAPGKYVSIKDNIRSFSAILAGEYDHLPEQAFYMVGSIDEAVAKAQRL